MTHVYKKARKKEQKKMNKKMMKTTRWAIFCRKATRMIVKMKRKNMTHKMRRAMEKKLTMMMQMKKERILLMKKRTTWSATLGTSILITRG